MTTATLTETTRREPEAAGDLDAELMEFVRLQDMQGTEPASIHTAFSSFPTCCS